MDCHALSRGRTAALQEFKVRVKYKETFTVSLKVFKKKTGGGTQCHGLVDEEVLGHRLD